MVSVIIPCHDQAAYLGEAIESVLRQDYGPVEIIVIDDGSTDETAAVAASRPGVVLVRQPNLGLAAARNRGLRESGGELLVFLDADDRLLSGALRAGAEALAADPACAFAAGHYRRIDAGGAPLEEPPQKRVERDHYRALLRDNFIAMHGTVMYRRQCLEAVGGFDPALRACEDYDAYLRIAREFPVRQHPTLVAEYRVHGGNMSRDPLRMMDAALAVLRKQAPHIRRDPAGRAALAAGVAYWRELYGRQLRKRLENPVVRPGARETAVLLARWLRRSPRQPLGLIGRTLMRRARAAARAVLPAPVRRVLSRGGAGAAPPPGAIRFGDLRRLEPISQHFGYDRGGPVDRHYIERFLAEHADDIHGRVLEVGDDAYTRRFGGERVTRSDVLHVKEGNPAATLVADLAAAPQLPPAAFDCIILTQTLQLIYDMRAALCTLHRILRPGGVLLATVPGISPLSADEWAATWYWSFTPLSVARLLDETFGVGSYTVEQHGNVLVATAFLYGIAAGELDARELDARDERFPVLIAVRAVRGPEAERAAGGGAGG